MIKSMVFNNRSIGIFLLVFITCSCTTLEYEEDEFEFSENSVYCKNVGFYGYDLLYPKGFSLIENYNSSELSHFHKSIIKNIVLVNEASEDRNYHFHKALFFKREDILIYFYPMQIKYVKQFHNVPLDYKIAYMKRFLRYSCSTNTVLSDQNDYGVFEDEENRRAVAWIDYENTGKSAYSVKEYYLTGKLNEVYVFGAFYEKDQKSLSEEYLSNFISNLRIR